MVASIVLPCAGAACSDLTLPKNTGPVPTSSAIEIRPASAPGEVFVFRDAGRSGRSRLRCRDCEPSAPQPLFIIDGVRVTPNSPKQWDIDPGDVDSIAIIRGIDALATYGEAGRNGVVLITLKPAP